ncbi:MAG: enoyl-CoA hydratase/isomerase family protein [Opitutaceae bacterium]|nr:enoyl-CoA hydratase/isomerase family protein [Opitutaceae bacterium]
MNPGNVELRVDAGVAWLTLDRPEALNALNLATIAALDAHVSAIAVRSDIRVVVTCGRGRAFCAGSDIKELAGMTPAAMAEAEARHAAAGQKLAALPQPTVALLHGYVLGGGLGLALYHDFRIAAADATLGLPEVALGWTPPWALGPLLQVVGYSTGLQLTLTGERVHGARAATLRLVNEAVPAAELTARGTAFAASLAALAPEAVRRTKALCREMSPLMDPAWDAKSGAAFAACVARPEARAALARFSQRQPKDA